MIISLGGCSLKQLKTTLYLKLLNSNYFGITVIYVKAQYQYSFQKLQLTSEQQRFELCGSTSYVRVFFNKYTGHFFGDA